MSGKNEVKNSIQTLIDGVNDVTGNQDKDLTGVINSLIEGYGQGGESGDVIIGLPQAEEMIF